MMAYLTIKKCKDCGKSFEVYFDSEPVPTKFCEECVCEKTWNGEIAGHGCVLQKGHDGLWHKCSCGKRKKVRDV